VNRSQRFDKKLKEINHYKIHPQMIPFIGSYWGKAGKMLVVGESNYLDNYDKEAKKRDNKDNKNIQKNWYNITSKELTRNQFRWTSTALAINEAITDDYFYPGWGIWRSVKDVIVETGFNPDKTNTSKVLCYLAYMNFFQRPALKSGESIDYDEEDASIANDVLNKVVKIIGVDYIFFVSSMAWDNFYQELLDELSKDKKIGHSCHPTCQWWNRESQKYTKPKGQKTITGKESFKYFIKTNKIFK